MKAVVIHEFGGPEVMRYEDFPTPEASPGEVVVEVHAVSVNRTLDLTLRAGDYVKPVELPHILGVDPSGIVSSVGEGVDSAKVGDRVFVIPWRPAPGKPSVGVGISVHGGYAEYVKCPAHATVPVPEDLAFDAATVAGRHLGAATLQIDTAEVKPDEWVLVMGATGGLGSAAMQVARYRGARVIGAAGTDQRAEITKQYGADECVNYRKQDLTDALMEITDGKGVDVVLENIADPTLFPKAFKGMGKDSRLVTSGAHGGGLVELDMQHLFRNRIRMQGVLGSSKESIASALEEAPKMKFKPMVDRTMPLAEAAEAHRLVGNREVSGKIILDPRA